jgi:sporulation protein YlmC with PRC-barrel domain
MRLDSLRHLAVIDPDTACRSGTVVDYWVDPTIGRVAALSMRPVDIDQPQRIPSTRVARVGHDVVMLTRAIESHGAGKTYSDRADLHLTRGDKCAVPNAVGRVEVDSIKLWDRGCSWPCGQPQRAGQT